METKAVDVMQTRIYGGSADDDSEAQSSVVALKVGSNGNYELCSGTLVAPNVVLTARHCVANSLTSTVSCDENGNSTNGKHVDGNHAPSDVTVYTGASPSFSDKPNATATAIISPTSDYLCNQDIALVVLDTSFSDIQPMAVRLDAPKAVVDGESVRSVGYGQNNDALPLGTRMRKDDVAILAMGRGVSASNTALGGNEFEVGESICEGDSGGPAISEGTGAIIGVVSRGGGCSDNFGHIYTATTAFKSLFDQAFALAGGAPTVESVEPVTSTDSTDPTSSDESSTATTKSASATQSGGCSVTTGAHPSTWTGVCGLGLALALVVRRRRR